MINKSFFEAPKIQRSLLKSVMDQNSQLLREILSLKKEMHELVRAEVVKAFGDREAMIEGALRESILHKKILMEKGFFTREELEAKYKELKEAARV